MIVLRNSEGVRKVFPDSDTASLMGWLSSQRGVVSAFPLTVLDGAPVPTRVAPPAGAPSTPLGVEA